MCEEALERLSVKIHGVRPEELPHDVASRMRAWLQGMDAVTLQVRLRGDSVGYVDSVGSTRQPHAGLPAGHGRSRATAAARS